MFPLTKLGCNGDEPGKEEEEREGKAVKEGEEGEEEERGRLVLKEEGQEEEGCWIGIRGCGLRDRICRM